MSLQLLVILTTTLLSTCTPLIINLPPPVTLSFTTTTTTPPVKVICALNTMATSSKVILPPTACTHLMLVNAGRIHNNELSVPMETMNNIKSLRLKIILSIGGWEEGVKNFQTIGKNVTRRRIFTESVGNFVGNHSIDSICIAWMWPGVSYRGGQPRDYDGLVEILKSLKTSLPTTPLGLLLPGQLIPSPTTQPSYPWQELSPLVTTFYVLAQDYAGNWDGIHTTGHPAPLYGKPSVNATITELFHHFDPHRLILGLPFFGRSFLLKNESEKNGLNEPHHGYFPSSFHDNPIGHSYMEICHLIKDERFDVFYDNGAVGMFALGGGGEKKKWVGFDGVESLREKLGFVEEKGLGGVMPWTIDYDDADGRFCGKQWALLGGFGGSSSSSSGGGIGGAESGGGNSRPIEAATNTNNGKRNAVTLLNLFVGLVTFMYKFIN